MVGRKVDHYKLNPVEIPLNPQSISKIADNLFLGNAAGANDAASLKKEGISHILRVLVGIEPPMLDGFTYKVLPLTDVTP